MHVEIQVALNFIISYLYNKLPRRRVNIFGEELEKGLKKKFQGHWYADKPFKGSGYRCVRVSNQLDPVIEEAARESGIELEDVRGNLPADLSVWIDPSEVSYKIGEKGAVKILYSDDNNDEHLDHEVRRSFNPEAQSFKPIDSLSSSMSNLSASPSSPHGSSPSPPAKSTSPVTTTFIPKTTVPLTFTTATFAQTKFGSTKLKTSAKRNSQRMSPTEFSQYIKQRSMLQQIARPRSSNPMMDYYNGQHQWLLDNNFLGENFPQGGNGLSDLSYLTNETTKAFLDVPPYFNQYPLLMAN